MGAMRRLMEEEMKLRGYRAKTIQIYVAAVRNLIAFHRQPVEKIGASEIRTYLLHLIETKHLSGSAVNQAVCALKFFFVEVLHRPWEVTRVHFQKRRRKLPFALAEEEIERLLMATSDLKQQVLLMTMYAAGLRLREALGLTIADIDSQQMRLRIREGKGGGERYVILSPTLLEHLRRYYKCYRPTGLLFYGSDPQQPLADRWVQRMVRGAAQRAGLSQRVTPHILRHSFATHLLEQGTSLPYIQELLGHKHFKTTLIYTHVSREGAMKVISPLDRLRLGSPPAHP